MKRKPKHKDGTIDVYWNEQEDDLGITWGKGVPKCDVNMLFNWFFTDILGVDKGDMPVIEELRRRGYDVTTLRMSIKKKAT